MHGAGTKRGTTIGSGGARCLDLTRLISRAGRRLTGVDRVEMAYLTRLLEEDDPIFALVRTSLGYILLERDGMTAIARCLRADNWPPSDFLSRFSNRDAPIRQRSEALVRRHALARCRPRGLERMVAKHLPRGASYINVGHSNLSARMLEAFAHAQRTVMIHDTIPLDYPQFQVPGSPERFAAKLRRVGRYADLVLYNSAQTQVAAERYFEEWRLTPKGLIAHLGVTEPDLTGGKWPDAVDPNRPTFVTIGTIEPRKNHALLLDVWDQIAKERGPSSMPQLVIAGARGWGNTKVFQTLDQKNPAIIELNSLSDPDLFTLLKGAKALLFPSQAEGFGMPPAEAVSLGTPVICAPLPVYWEFLADIPVYVDINDRYLWKKAVKELLDKEEDRSQKQANSTLIKLPTWADHFNTVLRVA